MDSKARSHSQEADTEPGPVRRWILNHDDSRWFVGLYIGLAVLLSVWLGLFWLVAIVGVHLALEWIRQAYPHRAVLGALARAVWEIKLDLALVLFALALALYLEVIAGAVGLGTGARMASQAGARAAAWQRGLRGVLLSLDDVAQVARAATRSRERSAAKGQGSAPETPAARSQADRPWRWPWSLGDRLSIAFGTGCGLLILVAPLLMEQTWVSTWQTLLAELRPFP